MSAVPTTAAPAAVRLSILALARRLALPLLFAASCAYQFLQARGHEAPTVFNDELLYAKLSQAIAAGLGLAVPAVCVLAVATRVQFLVLPFAYLAAVAVCGRGRWRRYALPVGLLAALGGILLLIPRALGRYGDATQYRYGVGAVAHWALTNAALLPFSLGLAVVPGALLGLGYAFVRARSAAERALAVVTVVITVLFLAQAALISAGEAHRP